jgi:hypothetical protein
MPTLLTRRLPSYIVSFFISYYAFVARGPFESDVYPFSAKCLYAYYDLL